MSAFGGKADVNNQKADIGDCMSVQERSSPPPSRAGPWSCGGESGHKWSQESEIRVDIQTNAQHATDGQDLKPKVSRGFLVGQTRQKRRVKEA